MEKDFKKNNTNIKNQKKKIESKNIKNPKKKTEPKPIVIDNKTGIPKEILDLDDRELAMYLRELIRRNNEK
ncbi:MAG: hypothetical protein K6B41_01215 [Butyrivibrio sp.]|nr:hypothetical protein [Butyrivibrio sp.]